MEGRNGDQIVVIISLCSNDNANPAPLVLQPEDQTWANFNALILSLYKSPPHAVIIKYLDDEGDWVDMGSEAEFSEALKIPKRTGELLQIQVVPTSEDGWQIFHNPPSLYTDEEKLSSLTSLNQNGHHGLSGSNPEHFTQPLTPTSPTCASPNPTQTPLMYPHPAYPYTQHQRATPAHLNYPPHSQQTQFYPPHPLPFLPFPPPPPQIPSFPWQILPHQHQLPQTMQHNKQQTPNTQPIQQHPTTAPSAIPNHPHTVSPHPSHGVDFFKSFAISTEPLSTQETVPTKQDTPSKQNLSTTSSNTPKDEHQTQSTKSSTATSQNSSGYSYGKPTTVTASNKGNSAAGNKVTLLAAANAWKDAAKLPPQEKMEFLKRLASSGNNIAQSVPQESSGLAETRPGVDSSGDLSRTLPKDILAMDSGGRDNELEQLEKFANISNTDETLLAKASRNSAAKACATKTIDEDIDMLTVWAEGKDRNSVKITTQGQDPFDVNSNPILDQTVLTFEDSSPTLTPTRLRASSAVSTNQQAAYQETANQRSVYPKIVNHHGTQEQEALERAAVMDWVAAQRTDKPEAPVWRPFSATAPSAPSLMEYAGLSREVASPRASPPRPVAQARVSTLHIMEGAPSGANAVAIEMEGVAAAGSGAACTAASEETGEIVASGGGAGAGTEQVNNQQAEVDGEGADAFVLWENPMLMAVNVNASSGPNVKVAGGVKVKSKTVEKKKKAKGIKKKAEEVSLSPEEWLKYKEQLAGKKKELKEEKDRKNVSKEEKERKRDEKEKVSKDVSERKKENKEVKKKEKSEELKKKSREMKDKSRAMKEKIKEEAEKQRVLWEKKKKDKEEDTKLTEDVESGEKVKVKGDAALQYNDFVKHIHKLKKEIQQGIVEDVTQRTLHIVQSARLNSLSGSRLGANSAYSGVEHTGIYCDNCNINICGIRYKCGNCLDFDLCERCERLSQSIHDPSHVFLKLRHSARNAGCTVDSTGLVVARYSLLNENIYDNRTPSEEKKGDGACVENAHPQAGEATQTDKQIKGEDRCAVSRRRTDLEVTISRDRQIINQIMGRTEASDETSFNLTMARGIDSGMSKIGQVAEERLVPDLSAAQFERQYESQQALYSGLNGSSVGSSIVKLSTPRDDFSAVVSTPSERNSEAGSIPAKTPTESDETLAASKENVKAEDELVVRQESTTAESLQSDSSVPFVPLTQAKKRESMSEPQASIPLTPLTKANKTTEHVSNDSVCEEKPDDCTPAKNSNGTDPLTTPAEANKTEETTLLAPEEVVEECEQFVPLTKLIEANYRPHKAALFMSSTQQASVSEQSMSSLQWDPESLSEDISQNGPYTGLSENTETKQMESAQDRQTEPAQVYEIEFQENLSVGAEVAVETSEAAEKTEKKCYNKEDDIGETNDEDGNSISSFQEMVDTDDSSSDDFCIIDPDMLETVEQYYHLIPDGTTLRSSRMASQSQSVTSDPDVTLYAVPTYEEVRAGDIERSQQFDLERLQHELVDNDEDDMSDKEESDASSDGESFEKIEHFAEEIESVESQQEDENGESARETEGETHEIGEGTKVDQNFQQMCEVQKICLKSLDGKDEKAEDDSLEMAVQGVEIVDGEITANVSGDEGNEYKIVADVVGSPDVVVDADVAVGTKSDDVDVVVGGSHLIVSGVNADDDDAVADVKDVEVEDVGAVAIASGVELSSTTEEAPVTTPAHNISDGLIHKLTEEEKMRLLHLLQTELGSEVILEARLAEAEIRNRQLEMQASAVAMATESVSSARNNSTSTVQMSGQGAIPKSAASLSSQYHKSKAQKSWTGSSERCNNKRTEPNYSRSHSVGCSTTESGIGCESQANTGKVEASRSEERSSLLGPRSLSSDYTPAENNTKRPTAARSNFNDQVGLNILSASAPKVSSTITAPTNIKTNQMNSTTRNSSSNMTKDSPQYHASNSADLLQNVASGVTKAATTAFLTARDVFFSLQARQQQMAGGNHGNQQTVPKVVVPAQQQKQQQKQMENSFWLPQDASRYKSQENSGELDKENVPKMEFNSYKPKENVYTPATSTFKLPEDTYVPPQSTYKPPSNTYNPPKDSYVPPSDEYDLPKDTYEPQINLYQYKPPQDTYVPPADTFTMPKSTYKTPEDSFSLPKSTYAGPGDTFTMPQSTFKAPEEVYTIPKSSYKVSDDSFKMPTSAYKIPENSFTMPKSVYQQQPSLDVTRTNKNLSGAALQMDEVDVKAFDNSSQGLSKSDGVDGKSKAANASDTIKKIAVNEGTETSKNNGNTSSTTNQLPVNASSTTNQITETQPEVLNPAEQLGFVLAGGWSDVSGRQAREKESEAMQKLVEMGFENREKNRALLTRFDGDLEKVVLALLGQ